MEKAITYPTDSKLLNRAREKLVMLAQKHGINLRQSYKRVGRHAYYQACRYGHAGHYKRMARQVKKLKVYLGRVVRDIERKAEEPQKLLMQDMVQTARNLIAQQKDSPHELYSLPAECIAKGKVHKKYEFGCKVSLVVGHQEGLVLSAQGLHGNPYDGHTLKAALNHAETLSRVPIKRSFVDKGYRQHGIEDRQVFMSGTKRLPPSINRALKRRSAIEPHIGHMKMRAW